MKQRIYTIIGAVIIISGLIWYMQMHFAEYYAHQQLDLQETEMAGANPDGDMVKSLLNSGNKQDAIDKLLEMVKENPDDLGVKLKLTQVYCNQCVLDTINCENAMWQLNSILKANPKQQDALQMKARLSLFLGDTLQPKVP